MLKSECFAFSSSSSNGAFNKNPDNNQFTVSFTNPLVLPENAQNCKIEIISAQIWNTSPIIISLLKIMCLQFKIQAEFIQ